MSSFVPNMPRPDQSLGNSRPEVLGNFAILRTAAGSDDTTIGDHVDVDDATDIGKHKWVHFENVTADGYGTPTTGATEVALFSNTIGGTTQLFYRPVSNGTVIQLTKTLPATVSNANGAGSQTYFTFLPGGKLMAYGFTQNSIEGGTINLSTVFITVDVVHLTALGNSSSGTNRALIAQPRSLVASGPGYDKIIINLQDVNNNDQNSARAVYFTVIGTT